MKRIVGIEGEKISGAIAPMAATLSERAPFDDPKWIFEIKWDGYRAIAVINHQKGNKLYSRNGVSFASKFKKVFDALNRIEVDTIIDGEIVVYGKNGKPSFGDLQNYRNNDKVIIQYQVFDCLSYKGKSLIDKPLFERKALLKKIIPKDLSLILTYLDHIDSDGISFFNEVLKLDLEGIIAKRKNSLYEPGKKSRNWLNIKNIKTQ